MLTKYINNFFRQLACDLRLENEVFDFITGQGESGSSLLQVKIFLSTRNSQVIMLSPHDADPTEEITQVPKPSKYEGKRRVFKSSIGIFARLSIECSVALQFL